MPFTATVHVEGVDQLEAAMKDAPKDLRRGLTKAMRKAALPAKAHADATVAWSAPVLIKARAAGAAVGSNQLVPPIIEFGNKAVIGSGGKVAPHVRKLTRQPALIPAVEAHVHDAAAIAEHELEAVLEGVLARHGTLKG
jgi:hypothetical protein